MRLLLSSLAFVGMTAAAVAADLPRRVAAPPIPAPAVMSWSGFYVGAHVGYGWADFEFQDPSITVAGVPGLVLPGGGLTLGLPIERKFDGDGFLGGGQVGVNAQWGGLVVGVEGDLSRTNLDGKVRSSAGPIPIPPLGIVRSNEGASADLEWLGTVRGRIGWALDRFLVYGTGGVAFGRVGATGDITVTNGVDALGLSVADHQAHVGWTAGVGVEGMITPNLSAKIEYLYADLGWEKHHGPAAVTATPGVAAFVPPGVAVSGRGDFKLEVQTVKLGLNYRFNLLGW